MSTTLNSSVVPRRLVLVFVTALVSLSMTLSPSAAPPAEAAVNLRVANRAAIIAVRQIGIPYVWGGTTRRGFDCSGLTQYAYRLMGKHIPRTALQQYRATIHIPRQKARRGDLVFFVRGGGVPHMGMYLGRGRMVVAPRTGLRVRVQLISKSKGRVVFGRVR